MATEYGGIEIVNLRKINDPVLGQRIIAMEGVPTPDHARLSKLVLTLENGVKLHINHLESTEAFQIVVPENGKSHQKKQFE